jgi:hypothetical protein
MTLTDTGRLNTMYNNTIRRTACGPDPSSTILQQGSTP